MSEIISRYKKICSTWKITREMKWKFGALWEVTSFQSGWPLSNSIKIKCWLLIRAEIHTEFMWVTLVIVSKSIWFPPNKTRCSMWHGRLKSGKASKSEWLKDCSTAVFYSQLVILATIENWWYNHVLMGKESMLYLNWVIIFIPEDKDNLWKYGNGC